MSNNLSKRKSVLIYCMLSLLLMLTILNIVMISINGPRGLINYFLELFESNKTETWVFLVTGSKGWSNYRHQADIAHAYQTLLNNGVPVDHIVVMTTDDVAYNNQNPYPEKLFNHPNGSDVHDGLKVDYTGKDVNSENFLNILTGNKKAMQNLGSGRVIESKHRDHIFLNFVGHGTSGILAFPDSYLYADELNIALQSMFNYCKFNKMLIYVEACRAGSLFDGILSETNNIFAVTAAGPRENSWSVYCVGENEESSVCLGDEFSVTWIEDQANYLQVNELIDKRTVLNHFNYIRTMVKLSNVMPYGDFGVGQDKLSTYIGKSLEVKTYNKVLENANRPYNLSKYREENNILKPYTKYKHFKKQTIDKVFVAILQGVIKRWPNFYGDINQLKKLPSNLPLSAFQCYKQTLGFINNNCFSLPKNTYSLKAVHMFFNLCAKVINSNEWKSTKFYVVFEEVVHNICLKNDSTFLNLHEITDIY